MKWLPTDFIQKAWSASNKSFVFVLSSLFFLFPSDASARKKARTSADTAIVATDTSTLATNISEVADDFAAAAIDSSEVVTLPDSVIRRMARALGMVDSTEVNALLREAEQQMVDTVQAVRKQTRYERNKERLQRGWGKLIPNQYTLQYAGSIGMFSAGFGWHYGRHDHWESEFLVGFVPKFHSDHARATFTLKQRYVPWHCRVSSRWTIQPLTTGFAFNTITGSEFWAKEPSKYPSGYYGFSTKIRIHVYVGQRLRYNIPSRKRLINSAVSAYYELSTCDLYIVSKAINKKYPWRNTLSLAFGLRWEL